MGYNKIRENYFVAEDGDQIVVNNGTDTTVLGISLKNRYHDVCLDEEATVRLLPANSDDPCHRFSPSDLTPAARGVLSSLPEGSYDDVSQQVQRLAEQTLPVCVKRDSGKQTPEANASSPAEKNKSTETEKAEETKKPAEGDNRRESDKTTANNKNAENSDLTTPGVSCREVK